MAEQEQKPIPIGEAEATSELTDEQRQKIQDLNDEIVKIWSKKGNYKIDDNAWKTMPAFMDKITENDILTNPDCAALQAIVYDGVPAEEIAEKLKCRGNEAMARAQDPAQPNKKNVLRAAIYAYTDGISQQCDDRKLNCILFSNRSQAQFEMQNYGHSVEDAQRAIILDPDHLKSYFRGSKALLRVKKNAMAREMAQQALERCAACGADPKTEASFVAMLEAVGRAIEVEKKEKEAKRRKQMADASEKGRIIREMVNLGIQVGKQAEMLSEQWEQAGDIFPRFEHGEDETGKILDGPPILHTSVTLLYDEASMSELARDVPSNACIADVLSSMLPLPWDDRGYYHDIGALSIFYIIDDGVKVPLHYEVPFDMPLIDIFRQKTYVMPGVRPSFHIVMKGGRYDLQYRGGK